MERAAGRMAEGGEPERVLRKALKDHEALVCGHVDGLSTFWSCIAAPARREIIRYSLGAPCRHEYKEDFRPGR